LFLPVAAILILGGCAGTALEIVKIRPNMTLISDFAPPALAEMEREISDTHTKISDYLGFDATPGEPVELYLFRWPAGYKDFLRRRRPEFLGSPACIFRERGKLIVAIRAGRKGNRVNLRHELTHVVLASNLHEAPQWLDEGLAQYFEAGAEPGVLKPEWLTDVQERFRGRAMPSVFELIVRSARRRFDRREYRASWILVHFLIRRNGVESLLEYAGRMGAGETAPMAFVLCFGASPHKMQEEWRDYVFSLEATSD